MNEGSERILCGARPGRESAARLRWPMQRHPLGRPGGDLLSRALRRSTIGPGGLNDRVRNGIGWGPPGKATRSTKRMRRRHLCLNATRARMSFNENDQADRAISTSKLHASRHFHTWPINVVVYHGSRRSLVLRLVSRLDAFSGYLSVSYTHLTLPTIYSV